MALDLPFLKRRKTPRHQDPVPDKMVGLDGDEQLEDQCIDELMQAHADKDCAKFRKALEALVLNSFQWGEHDAG